MTRPPRPARPRARDDPREPRDQRAVPAARRDRQRQDRGVPARRRARARAGRGAIVLVPEIALTPQLVARASAARFGERVALLHCALSAGERFDEWRRIRGGTRRRRRRLALGALRAAAATRPRDRRRGARALLQAGERAALPRRDLALALGRIADAVVVLGSATPRVTRITRATAARCVSFRSPSASSDLAMPPTTIVDLRLELKAGNRGTLSRALRLALERTVAKGEQAILYLNRRGFATVVLCRDCGHVVNCPACDIPFAYHSDGSLVATAAVAARRRRRSARHAAAFASSISASGRSASRKRCEPSFRRRRSCGWTAMRCARRARTPRCSSACGRGAHR